ncbi:MAG TPA: ABC transporter ATP-binding protein [Thermoanaerobaculia bacterium]|nr:ABC transporter ATP-binding protein [Thermoanaerobaculia bacterium]
MRQPVRESHAPVVLRKVTHHYGEVTALDRVELEIEPGTVTSILGPNGAGKTTAVKLMLGLARPAAGTVELYGDDPTLSRHRVRTGAMMQISSLPHTLAVRELVELFRCYYPRPLPYRVAIEAAGLEGIEGRLYGKLSGGQKQRVLFALALCGDPDLLFLDEPSVGLDVETRRGFWTRVRELVGRGKTIVLTTHYLEEADAFSDRIVVLHRGRVRADGTPHEIKSRAAARRIRCVTDVPPAQIATLPGVRSARYDKAAVEVLAVAAEPVLRELLARDPRLRDLEITGAGIEDAFLSITGEADASRSDEPADAA